MNSERFQIFLDRHGADPARWPRSERAAAERFVSRDPEADGLLRSAQRLDAALARHAQSVTVDETAVARVRTRLAGPLPRQRTPFWRLPLVLLDWKFAPAWPRMAALACCAVIGFMVGIAGLDPRINTLERLYSNPSGAELVFEPESLTGVRP